MKTVFRFLFRLARAAFFLFGGLALLAVALQFTPYPGRSYRSLSVLPGGGGEPPTHILVMGGSGIPGESGLSRTFFGARAALLHRRAAVLIALPLGTNQSFASRAYVEELRLRGVPAKRIQVLDGGRNTREQALRLAERLADRTNAACVWIVTSPDHVRRTAACIRKACADAPFPVRLEALPAFPLSIEDPLEFAAAELDAPGHASAARAVVPDVGSSFVLRYNFWVNVGYSMGALREYAAMGYYRLRGWI